MIAVGQPFPQFALQNENKKIVQLGDFRGKWLLVFVYPKDDTPGCTLEGRSFTAAKTDFDEANAVAVGLSADDADSHKSFCEKFGFSVPLLADPKAELLNSLGVKQSDYKGTMYWDRTSYLVDPKGIVQKIYLKVNPQGHEQEVLSDIRRMQAH